MKCSIICLMLVSTISLAKDFQHPLTLHGLKKENLTEYTCKDIKYCKISCKNTHNGLSLLEANNVSGLIFGLKGGSQYYLFNQIHNEIKTEGFIYYPEYVSCFISGLKGK